MHARTALIGFLALAVSAAALAAPSDDRFAQVRGFKVEIDGILSPDLDLIGVESDPVTFDVLDTGAVSPDGFRVYGPGDAHFGSITVRYLCSSPEDPIQTWFQEAARGGSIRKNITVKCLKRDGSEAKKYNYLDCFPTKWSASEASKGEPGPVRTITCSIGRIELVTRVAGGGGHGGHGGGGGGGCGDSGLRGWYVDDIDVSIEPEGRAPERSSEWLSVEGGAVAMTPSAAGTLDLEVEPLTLVTDARAHHPALADLLNGAMSRTWQPCNFRIRMAGPDARVRRFETALPVSLALPSFDACTGTTGNVEEEVRLKFIRFEMQ